MLKLLGCLMLIACGALCGNRVGELYKARLETHKKLLRLYTEAAILLEYSLCTFGEIIEHLAKNDELKEFGFLNIDTHSQDIRQELQKSIDQWDSPIEDKSVNNLRVFFSKLGTTDIQGQLSYARLAAEQEQEIIDSVKKQYVQRINMSGTFGILGGVFAALMMI